MKKTRLMIKIFCLIGSAVFCALSYSNSSVKKDCYAQFFNPKKSAVKFPEKLKERHNLLKIIESDPNKYADLLNLPKDSNIRKHFFYTLSEAIIIPAVEEIYPNLTQHKSNEKAKTSMGINIIFKQPNLKLKPAQ